MVESVAGTKPRLGRDFGRLWSASVASNLSDGIALAAGPLLVASLTDNPVLISGAAAMQQVPWLLFSLISGAYVDRLDRRRLVVLVNVLRAAVVAGLAVTVWTGVVTIPIVYAAFFLVGVAETFADNAAGAMIPAVVDQALLPTANARLTAAQMVGNMMIAPPVGAAAFVLATALPFGVNALGFLVAALLFWSIRYRPVPTEPVERKPLRIEIVEGLRWLWAHRLVRVLAVCLCLMNIAFFGPYSVLVPYAREHLGLPEIGFGALLAATAVGGLLGTAVVSRLQARLGDGRMLRIGLITETLTHFALAMAEDEWLAGAILVVFGAHGAIWGVVSMSVRHRVVPDRLRGRVGSVYLLLVFGGAALGSLLGGVAARAWGVTAPFWLAGVAMVVLSAFAWRHFSPSAFAEVEHASAGEPTA